MFCRPVLQLFNGSALRSGLRGAALRKCICTRRGARSGPGSDGIDRACRPGRPRHQQAAVVRTAASELFPLLAAAPIARCLHWSRWPCKVMMPHHVCRCSDPPLYAMAAARLGMVELAAELLLLPNGTGVGGFGGFGGGTMRYLSSGHCAIKGFLPGTCAVAVVRSGCVARRASHFSATWQTDMKAGVVFGARSLHAGQWSVAECRGDDGRWLGRRRRQTGAGAAARWQLDGAR